jgi:hypothetical protein
MDIVVDMGGQAVFEAGVLLWEMAFRRHPICDSYPHILDVTSHDSIAICAMTVDEQAAASAAGYPVHEFSALVRGMVAMDPATRPSLTEARRQLETMMSVTSVGDALVLCGCW